MRWELGVAMTMACTMAMGQASASPNGVRAHEETSFELVVHAPYVETAALLGPEGERAWAGKQWDPKFIHPLPARDEAGGVFTIHHGPFDAVWVIAEHDLEARHFKYVYFIADLMVTTIDVRFDPVDAATTKVKVKYARTAVTAEGDEHVRTMSAGDRDAGRDWQQAIDEYLAARKAEPGR